MLTRLFIQNVVLIKSLSLDFSKGLTVLTGETGAGKSILLDALSLALGGRSDAGLIRKDNDALLVSAEFDIPNDHPIRPFLAGQGFVDFDTLTLRRTVSRTGLSRAFLNDHSITIGFLKEVSSHLAEVYSQFAVQELFAPSSHLSMLDTYAGLETDVSAVQSLFRIHKELTKEIEERKLKLEQALQQEHYLTFAVKELSDFAPEAGEEEALSKKREVLKHSKQIKDALSFAAHSLSFDSVSKVERTLEKANAYAPDVIGPVLEQLSSARIQMDEARGLISEAFARQDDTLDLETIDERFFLLKDLYRKYRVSSEQELIDYLEKAKKDLSSLSKFSSDIGSLLSQQKKVFEDYKTCSLSLRDRRKAAALRLQESVMSLFPQLKMERARFFVEFKDIEPSSSGLDGVQFLVSMNAGGNLGAIHKIASGGELSRLILALKVNLSSVRPHSLIVFDEIDMGIGGAVSSAVGALLSGLSADRQVMVITHAPQVTAFSSHHFKVAKTENDGVHVTDVSSLSEKERIEELARMLSGENVTPEARSAAQSLLLEACHRPSGYPEK